VTAAAALAGGASVRGSGFTPTVVASTGSADIIMKSEHVERLSVRLLWRLEEQLRQNRLLYGEIYETTYCHANPDWCTMLNMADEPFETADRQHYSFFHNELPSALLQDVRSEHLRDRWMHAVKWIRNSTALNEALQRMPWLERERGGLKERREAGGREAEETP
jgi:hypothetical protein